ncbi:MAG: hypothetical protein WBG30_08950 [Psychrilyobacter sp.]|uniref:hypothetical protein n=1 Tax=Psychrilyobacter sp. TaxID=2586924 RepID=UPI003C734B89
MKITMSRRELPKYYPVKGGGNVQLYEYDETKNEVQEMENEEGLKVIVVVRKGYKTFVAAYKDEYFADIEVGEVEGEKQYKKWIEIEENYDSLLEQIKNGEIEQI